MDITTYKYALQVSQQYELTKTRSHNPLRINFRCPICGDSKVNMYETRGWFYEYKGELRYGCFNCNKNYPFPFYLKLRHPEIYRHYILEKNGDRYKKKEPTVEADTSNIGKKSLTSIIDDSTINKYCVRLDRLPEGHPALLYMQNRLIPEERMCLFWFTMKWRELANAVKPNTCSNNDPEPRIVIPIFDEKGNIASMQGRALRSTEKLRYMTVKSSEDANKVYGLERINPNETVFYLEGPIDSVFIDNALAIVGGTMSLEEAPHKKTRVWVLDNEPRSKDTCARMLKLIEAGERIVIWDKCKWQKKDVNDMILKEGATKEEINQYLRDNIVKGLRAKIRFNEWKKVIL
ncbi:MAG: hypothetical protein ACRDCE_00325 [Cetobacterium sp.]|uniref:hypothetical protein n=1 Tax=Cetobacterium sp. TaxID=2071632 RepID=UPI003EE5091B